MCGKPAHLALQPEIVQFGAMTQTPHQTVDESPKSPCVSSCAVSGRSGFCIGCGRRLIEIAGWSGFSDAEKRDVLAQLPARLAGMKPA